MLECDADTYKALNSLADFKLYVSSLKVWVRVPTGKKNQMVF